MHLASGYLGWVLEQHRVPFASLKVDKYGRVVIK